MKMNIHLCPGDMERFADILQHLRKEGVEIPEDAEVGYNETHGNVFIYSEDWAGTVYEGLNNKVAWLFTCLECGHKEDFPSLEALENWSNDTGGLCQDCCGSD